ncbi:MAG: hypothetical protein Q7S74_01025 [Nanoarchaeota archaeon]|nr:hypothetical protein [Nanoarchaeota archaeon]
MKKFISRFIKTKKGFEFSFAWIFAIFVGAVIIVLAIYATTKIIKTQQFQQSTISAKEIGILLSPIETNLEEAKFTKIVVNQETKIFNECYTTGTFGSQKIGLSTKSGIGEEWPPPGVKSTFYNKYLFSSPQVHGKKEFYVISKPFNFPFKIADIVVLWDDQTLYCFTYGQGAPLEMNKELKELNATNIMNASSPLNCPQKSIKVCVSSSGPLCNITVDVQAKTVKKGISTVHYEESFDSGSRYSLLYAAIFSNPEIYDCQFWRLMQRASKLSLLYNEKSKYLSSKGCGSELVQPVLVAYSNSAAATPKVKSSTYLTTIKPFAQNLQNENAKPICNLF